MSGGLEVCMSRKYALLEQSIQDAERLKQDKQTQKRNKRWGRREKRVRTGIAHGRGCRARMQEEKRKSVTRSKILGGEKKSKLPRFASFTHSLIPIPNRSKNVPDLCRRDLCRRGPLFLLLFLALRARHHCPLAVPRPLARARVAPAAFCLPELLVLACRQAHDHIGLARPQR